MKHCKAEATTAYHLGPAAVAAPSLRRVPHPDHRNATPASAARHHGEAQRFVNKIMSKQNEFLERLRSVSEKHIRESERSRGAAAARGSHRGNSKQKTAAAPPPAKTVTQTVATPPATIISRTNSMGQSVVSSLGGTYAESPRIALSSFSPTELVESVKDKVNKQFQVLAVLAERVTTLGSGGRPPRWVDCQGGGEYDDDDDVAMKHTPTNANTDGPCAVPTCIVVNKCSTDSVTTDDDTNATKPNTKIGEKDDDDVDEKESVLATIGTATTKEDTDTADEEEFTTTVDESTMAEPTAR